MFDDQTAALIRSAPRLEGLDGENLPKALASAYATIVATRIRLRSIASRIDKGDGEIDATGILEEMRRLASTQEALASLSPEGDERRAAAFVAGVAHHVVVQAKALRGGNLGRLRLELNGIPAEVSAVLLFLAAEAHADAAEMAKYIVAAEDAGDIEKSLLAAIADLAKGHLSRITTAPAPSAEGIIGLSEAPGATALYLMILRAVRSMAGHILGESDQGYISILREVAELSIWPLTIDPLNGASACVYPGPCHLASLLMRVADSLPSTALAGLPPPEGIDFFRWQSKMRQISGKRPYLWRNHRQAILEGYLDKGCSAIVSFPTGAGKSTLSELKIASTLIGGSKVIFLAPTLALVDQVATSLKQIFPEDEIQRERSVDSVEEIVEGGLRDISVVTPERCLALLGFDAGAFADVGLLVFDECHLMHGNEKEQNRRSIDSMLCILNFSVAAPAADMLLLSAMMSNASEISEWISHSFGKRCLALSLNWKPTRQVRGVLLYRSNELVTIREILHRSHAKRKTSSAPAAVQAQLQIQPFGFLGLNQTWNSQAREDYLLTPLLDSKVTLATGKSRGGDWYLTPNGVQVATEIAAGAAFRDKKSPRLKTLIFASNIKSAISAAKRTSMLLGDTSCELTEGERRNLEVAVLELGSKSRLYLQLDDGGTVTSSAIPHHGLLLPAERSLHESLYKRLDGVDVLVATSTLAQGMNLPSQVVIIASDQRFDVGADQMETMEAHELLNAAGRAGRAGESSYGFVLVVPGKVMYFDNEKALIHQHWSHLQAIFSQSDQCLAIEDPLAAVLDNIHDRSHALDENGRYFLRRLPIAENVNSSSDVVGSLLRRSLAAYRKQKQGDFDWIASRTSAAVAARSEEGVDADGGTWLDRLASSAGIDTAIVRALAQRLDSPPADHAEVQEWVDWVFSWLTAIPSIVPQILRKESLEGLFGKPYKELTADDEKGAYCIPMLRVLLDRWMQGCSLEEIEQAFGTKLAKAGKCENARKFVIRVIPDLAYVFSLPEQIIRASRKASGLQGESSASCSMLGSCVREGFDSVEKIALAYVLNRSLGRRAVHARWDEIDRITLSAIHPENWKSTLQRVRSAFRVDQAIN